MEKYSNLGTKWFEGHFCKLRPSFTIIIAYSYSYMCNEQLSLTIKFVPTLQVFVQVHFGGSVHLLPPCISLHEMGIETLKSKYERCTIF